MAIAAGGVTAAVDDVPAPSLEPPPPPPQPTPAAPAPARLTETALERRMEAAIAQLRQIVADGKELLAPASSEAERLSVQETVVLELEKTLAPARAALAAARAGVGLLEPTRGYFVAPGALKGNSLERLKPGIESGSWQSRPIGVDPRAVAPSDADAAAAAAVAAAERAAAAAEEEEDEPEAAPLVPFDTIGPNAGKKRRRKAAAASPVAAAAGGAAAASGPPAAAATAAAAPSVPVAPEEADAGAGAPKPSAAKAKPPAVPRKRKAAEPPPDAGEGEAAATGEPAVAGQGGGPQPTATAATVQVEGPTRSPGKRRVKRPHNADMIMYGE